MIEETLTIEHVKARFPEWIIAYDPSAHSYWLLHWRYLDIGWRRVGSMLQIEAEIHDVQRRCSPYILSWERHVQDQPRAHYAAPRA
ncbi:hypothetical protein GCM10023196_064650 [Actinoallomurus vinaceus]|uniref:Uncharacterized protein n=1 Tax=Actinoallomurus vinaceus TaxID=1080074 RepID=A0ABP8UIF7_9ACTN